MLATLGEALIARWHGRPWSASFLLQLPGMSQVFGHSMSHLAEECIPQLYTVWQRFPPFTLSSLRLLMALVR